MQYSVRIQAGATDIKVDILFWCGALNISSYETRFSLLQATDQA
jgi:hypothetical protein